MKKLLYSCLSALFISFGISAEVLQMPENPFIRIDSTSYKLDPVKFKNGQKFYTADPSARVWTIGGEEILYVYPSHDMEPANGCDMMDRYHVFSSKNMLDWTDYGEIFNADSVPWGIPIITDFTIKNDIPEGAPFMWAPDCMYKDGTYYYYFPKPYGPKYDNWRIGIATSNSPHGPFTVKDTTLLGLPKKGCIDPNIFKDDNGKHYFYYGGGGECYGVELDPSMTKIKGNDSTALTKFDTSNQLKYFHEGAWVFKRDGVYYMTYPGQDPKASFYVKGQDQMLYATSNNPLGPWVYKGPFLAPTGCDTSHGSVVKFKGQWYVFYHNKAWSGKGNLRSICVDKLFFNDDGSIKLVHQTGKDITITSKQVPGVINAVDFMNGGEGVAYYDSDDINSAEVTYRLTGVDMEICSEDGFNITDIQAGEWLKYRFTAKYNDVYRLEIRYSSGVDNAQLYFDIDDKYQSNIISLPKTTNNSRDKWKSIFIHGIPMQYNNHIMTVNMVSGGFKLNDFTFSLDYCMPEENCFVSLSNINRYVTLTGNENNPSLICNKSTPVTDTEKFQIKKTDECVIALKANNNKYVERGTSLVCSSDDVSDYTNFVWSYVSPTEIVLKSAQNNSYITVPGTGNMTTTTSKTLSTSEKFKFDNFCIAEETETETCYYPVSINNVNIPGSNLTLYPVPAKESVNVVAELKNSSDITIIISDLQGKTLQTMKKNVNSGISETNINVSGFSPGLYLINVLSPEFNIVKKIVIIN